MLAPASAEARIRARVFFCALVFVFACGLSLYLIPQWVFGASIEFTGPRHDGYIEIASMLVAGEGYRFEPDGLPVMHRPPLYPVLLTPAALLPSGWREIYVIALNSTLAGATAWMLMLLAQRLFGSSKVGGVAVVFYLASPWLYRQVSLPHTALLQTTLYLASSLLVLYLVLGERDESSLSTTRFRSLALLFGLAGGLLTLTHGVGFLAYGLTWLALLVFVVCQRADRKGSRVFSMLLSLCIASCIAAPWVVRNATVLPISVPITTGASFNYFMGNAYWNLGGHGQDTAKSLQENALRAGGVYEPAESALRFWGVMSPENEKVLADNMRAHMLANPGHVLYKSLLSLSENFLPITHRLYCRNRTGVACTQHNRFSMLHRSGLSVYYLALIVLALFAILRDRERRPALLMFALGGVHIAPYLPLGQWAPHGIYGLSAVLLIMVFAAATFARLVFREKAVGVAAPG